MVVGAPRSLLAMPGMAGAARPKQARAPRVARATMRMEAAAGAVMVVGAPRNLLAMAGMVMGIGRTGRSIHGMESWL